MPKFTEHGKKRISERLNATSDSSSLKNATKAFRLGIKHSETQGDLRDWISAKFLKHNSGNNMRIYRGFLYVFHEGALITVYEVPKNLQTKLSEYVDKDAFERYLTDLRFYEKKKTDKKEQKEAREKENERRAALLSAVRRFADGKYDVDITNIAMDQRLMTIYYIPRSRKIPCMDELAGHIRSTTRYSRVRLVHVKDKYGEPVYNI